MGASAAVAALSVVGGMLASKALSPDIPSPGTPPAAPTTDPATATKKATGAAEQQRKRAAGAVGRSDTILTGPKGLGEIGSDNTQTKSLLGY